MGELRDFRQATVASFNAMREDFVALRADFSGLRREMGDKFEVAAAGQQQIVTLLGTLIDRDSA